MNNFKKRNFVSAVVLFLVSSILFGCSAEQAGNNDVAESAPEPVEESKQNTVAMIDEQRINNADSEPGNWLAHGRNYEEHRFSPLTEINRETIGQLGLAWFKDMGTNRTLEATPIVVDGIMYLSSAWSKVYAIDAVTGEEIWFYDPKVPGAWARKSCCDVVNRGVAVYKGRVYVGSLDGFLIALDAATGEEVWRTDTLIDRSRDYTITGAPRAANGKVYIGNGGAERGVRGYASAFDAETGELVWRFYTVPGDPSKPFEHPEMELAAETWKGGEWWKIGGGGTVWNSIVYDPDFNHIYLGVGNGSPWTRAIRSPGGGDNLFLSSIVALDADSGKMKWYYQTTPGDNWDYTATQDMVLADLEVDGVDRKVLLQAPKNGFFYVLDRSNGELLRAHKYVNSTWATHVDMETGRPVENPEVDYIKEAHWILPGPIGGHNWQAMSYDKKTGLMYLPAMEVALSYGMDEEWEKTGSYEFTPNGLNVGIEVGRILEVVANAKGTPPKPKGILKAFNPLTGEQVWGVEQLHYWNGGVLATEGGLVFQGTALGEFNAHDIDTGETLWSFNAYTAFLAPPVSYQIDGVQYVALMAGTGGAELWTGDTGNLASLKYGNFGKLLVFKLDGKAELPPPTIIDRTIPEQPEISATEEELEQGYLLYHDVCSLCHGIGVRSGGVVKDLRLLTKDKHAMFKDIVLEGVLESIGMASFDDLLDEKDVENIQAYIVARANEDREAAAQNQSSEAGE